jgi:two-component system, OmpR family, sensor histidine kinase KdpD
MLTRPGWSLARGARPRPWVGVAVVVGSVAACTVAIYPLAQVAPVVSLGVVYLLAVLLVSAYWGLAFGLSTALLSATAFNFFHLPPVGTFTIADSRNWVSLGAFTVVAVAVSAIAELARASALESERRRGEADLAAALARELLGGSATGSALGVASRRVAEGLGISSAAIELGIVPSDHRRIALALSTTDGEQIATLLVPRALPDSLIERLRRQLAPALGALVAIALRRDAMQAEAVRTEALRRSDDVKTALLRAVSHDLRSPLTAIVAAGHALSTGSLSDEERTELSAAVVEEGTRLASLVDKLLDLSKLQAGKAEPRRDWISLEDVLSAAREGLTGTGEVRITIDPEVPEMRADAAQLERAFANLLENARRYSRGLPVSVHVRRSGQRVIVQVVDQGPGIAPADRDRIFEPFYRASRPGVDQWTGSGLGLAIAKGFIEIGGGEISVESLPGQGTSFVVSLPIEQRQLATVPV